MADSAVVDLRQEVAGLGLLEYRLAALRYMCHFDEEVWTAVASTVVGFAFRTGLVYANSVRNNWDPVVRLVVDTASGLPKMYCHNAVAAS
jgi:hypothetical protein